MSLTRHLENKIKERKEEYDLLTEKIKRFRQDLGIEASTDVKFKLDNQIDIEEKKRDRLAKEIDSLESSLESEQIHIELFRLNYRKQVRLFREFIDKKNGIGAFLVHGSQDHGQIFLLKCLLRAIPNSSQTPPIQFHLSRKGSKTKIEALWRELGRSIEVQDFSSPEIIARDVVSQLKNQHVILVFDGVDCMDEDYLNELIRKFWLPLVNSTQEAIYSNNEFFLLMFLIDQDGCVDTWNIGFAKKVEAHWEPCTPIKLPIIERLSDEVLLKWMEDASYANALPRKLTEKIHSTVQLILENSDGVPQSVFAEIFRLCGCTWEQEEDRWLKL